MNDDDKDSGMKKYNSDLRLKISDTKCRKETAAHVKSLKKNGFRRCILEYESKQKYKENIWRVYLAFKVAARSVYDGTRRN